MSDEEYRLAERKSNVNELKSIVDRVIWNTRHGIKTRVNTTEVLRELLMRDFKVALVNIQARGHYRIRCLVLGSYSNFFWRSTLCIDKCHHRTKKNARNCLRRKIHAMLYKTYLGKDADETKRCIQRITEILNDSSH
jgi:urocanate hydratase